MNFYAYNISLLSAFKLNPYQVVLHTYPGILLKYEINFTLNAFQTCYSTYCSEELTHSLCHNTDLNPFSSFTLSKPTLLWLFIVEKAMIETYSTVHKHNNSKLTSHSSIIETAL